MVASGWLLVATGVSVGVVSGMLGIGGAVLLVPVLVMAFGFTQPQAQGTALGVLVPPIGIFAAIQYYRGGYIDVRVAALIAVGFAFGAWGGATLVPHVSVVWLRRAFATMLVYLAAQLMFADSRRRAGASVTAVMLLWLVHLVRKTIGRRPPPPPDPPPRPPGDEACAERSPTPRV